MSVLEAHGLGVAIRRRRIIQGVDLALASGEVVGLIGANGSGKSTLLRALSGHWVYQAGGILLLGKPLRMWSPGDRARRLAYLPQAREIHAPLKVREVVALGRVPHAEPWSEPSERDASERSWRVTSTAVPSAARARRTRIT